MKTKIAEMTEREALDGLSALTKGREATQRRMRGGGSCRSAGRIDAAYWKNARKYVARLQELGSQWIPGDLRGLK